MPSKKGRGKVPRAKKPKMRTLEMLPEVAGAKLVYAGVMDNQGTIAEITKRCVPALVERTFTMAMESDNLSHVTAVLREFSDRAYGKAKETIKLEHGSDTEAIEAVKNLIKEGVFTRKQGKEQLKVLGILDVEFEEVDD